MVQKMDLVAVLTEC